MKCLDRKKKKETIIKNIYRYMGCNCKNKNKPSGNRKMYYPATETEEAKIVEEPIEEVPETPEQFHAKEMDAYAKRISEDTMDWFDNLDTINPLDD